MTDKSELEKRATILLIDDEPQNLRVVVDYLTNHNFRVLVSQNGQSGLDRAQHAQPDLILLDVILPDLDGFDVCRQLKENPQTALIPVLFMTILTIPQDRVKAFEVGGVDYVTKQYRPDRHKREKSIEFAPIKESD